MAKERIIRPKGNRETQSMYFLNYEMLINLSFGAVSSRESKKQRNQALYQRTKGLILQNPKPEDLPKYKIH
ncbi:MAG: hypothetical protein Q8Q30_03030 [Candidatus Woesebacteria bacterium]|nr:hypothetical protein [Candidatus Woesebacteria bacterium]